MTDHFPSCCLALLILSLGHNREEEAQMESYGSMAILDAQEACEKWGLEIAGGGVLVEPVSNQVRKRRAVFRMYVGL